MNQRMYQSSLAQDFNNSVAMSFIPISVLGGGMLSSCLVMSTGHFLSSHNQGKVCIKGCQCFLIAWKMNEIFTPVYW